MRIRPFGICPERIFSFGIHPQSGQVREADKSQRDWSLRDTSTKWISPHSGYIPTGFVLKGFVPTRLVHKVDQLILVPVESTKTLYCFPLNKTLNVKLFHCEGKVPLNTNSPFLTRIPPNPMVTDIHVPAIEVM